MINALAAPATPGTVYVRSWGYDQTNVDYYELVEVSKSGKSGKARKLRSVLVASGGSSERVTAATGPERFVTDPRCARCSNYHAGLAGWDGHTFSDLYSWSAKYDRITVGKGEHAFRWDGQSDYQTAAGWGH
jgi:hypothetical protein